MVLMPLLGIFTKSGLIGWASAPYDPYWSQRYPKRAAWMSLAGPMANFALVIISGLMMRIGILSGLFAFPSRISLTHLVQARSTGDFADGLAVFLSILFTMNVLLGTFNLLPIPPLDGFSVLGLFLPESGARKLAELRITIGMYSFIGLLLAWRIFGDLYYSVLGQALRVLYFSASRAS
jgi:Zn-dependent protease